MLDERCEWREARASAVFLFVNHDGEAREEEEESGNTKEYYRDREGQEGKEMGTGEGRGGANVHERLN